jgi:L-alanine-DL-glutamate epimerase-like enolase superfamily enzyme
VPIAAGEVLSRRQTFAEWLRAGALDVAQPDVTRAGGLSELRRIGWLAEEHGANLIPHGWNTAVGLAVDVVEFIYGSPYIDDLSAKPWRLDADRMLAIPDRPGLGLRLNPEAMARYAGGEL